MTELRFHREIYTADAVDQAVQVFTRFGRFERADTADYRVVQVTARTPDREKHIARELCNHALGLTRRAEVLP